MSYRKTYIGNVLGLIINKIAGWLVSDKGISHACFSLCFWSANSFAWAEGSCSQGEYDFFFQPQFRFWAIILSSNCRHSASHVCPIVFFLIMWKYINPLVQEIKSSSVIIEFSYSIGVLLSQIHSIKRRQWLHVWRD